MSITYSASTPGDTEVIAAVKHCEGGERLEMCCAWVASGIIELVI